MKRPVSLRLDDDVRAELEREARGRGIGLSTLLRDLASEAAQEYRRRRIRQSSAAVAQRVAASKEARSFYEQWGTPSTYVGA